jgi:hypothetical protein
MDSGSPLLDEIWAWCGQSSGLAARLNERLHTAEKEIAVIS